MWEKIRVVFTIPELRQKILLTLGLLAIYRLGFWITLPFVDQQEMTNYFGGAAGAGKLLQQVAMFSASQLDQATIFGLGIMPYISASIIFQLLATVWPPLERLQKEGETGRKKINEYTRYATVVLCLGQSWFYLTTLGNLGEGGLFRNDANFVAESGQLFLHWKLVAALIMTAGATFLMWMGEQIDEYGIGNGISLLIMAGILARMPDAAIKMFQPLVTGGVSLGGGPNEMGVEKLLVLAVLFMAVVAGVVLITLGQRRIPTQSAKHVRGRRVFGGGRQYLPLKVNHSGVMPIVFASSLLLFPMMIFNFLRDVFPNSTIMNALADSFRRGESSFFYNLMYVVLIYFFTYFWTAIMFNPNDVANNLKDFGSFIPGYRPGKRTADYLEKVMARITFVGAAFLAVVAILPTVISSFAQIDYNIASFYGGTGLLIAVSVAFDLVQKIDSHLVMRNYKGLLEKS